MTFTKDQMEVLSQFEDYFRTAVNADWCRHPGASNLATMHQILHAATGDNRRFDANCQHCILTLVRDTGRIYFRDKEAYAALETKEVKAEEIPVKKVRAKVSTKKKD